MKHNIKKKYLGLTKIKKKLPLKYLIKKMKMKVTHWEKIFATHI